MKKHLLTLALMGAALTGMAQTSAADLFTSAPQNVFPLLDQNTRLDMVDYYQNEPCALPRRTLSSGRSLITEMTPASLTVKMTDSSAMQSTGAERLQRDLWPFCSTVSPHPGLDSNIKFFDSDWKPASR